MTITTADLMDRWGVNTTDVHRWVSAGILCPVEGGGSGSYYLFEDRDGLVVQALLAWRRATTGGGISSIIGRQVRDQLRVPHNEPTATSVTVTVELAPGVTVVLELER